MKQEETKQVEILDAEQLNKLQDFNAFIDKARMALGELSMQFEFQKADILTQISVQQQKIAELEKEIKDEYGDDIQVNIETGEIIKPEKQ